MSDKESDSGATCFGVGSLCEYVGRIEVLEHWKRCVDEKFLKIDSELAGGRLIGIKGLERRYLEFFERVVDDCRDVRSVVDYFFRKLTHDERISIFSSSKVITAYIANDPVYYQEVLDVIDANHSKAIDLFRHMHTIWASHESLAMTDFVICSCGQKVEVPNGPHRSNKNVTNFDGNIELLCFVCKKRLGVWDGLYWIAYRPGWTVKLDGLVKRKHFGSWSKRLCEMCGSTPFTRERWSGKWLCDTCNRVSFQEYESKEKKESGSELSLSDVMYILSAFLKQFDLHEMTKEAALKAIESSLFELSCKAKGQ